MIAYGKMGEVDWIITDSGELIIGKEGETQTFDYAAYRAYNSWGWYLNRNKVLSVSFKGQVIGNGSHENMFYGCFNLTSLNTNNFDTSNITTMSNMFYNCQSLISLNLSNFNTSNVTSMKNMFSCCEALASLDLSSFNTSNVTSMRNMFSDCEALTSLDLSNFNTSNVTDMESMFDSCESLVSLNVNNFNTFNVTTMYRMFYGCDSLVLLNINNFNTSNVTNMNSMFCSCKSLASLNLSNFNTSNVTIMGNMFNSCEALASLDLSNFNTSNVTNMNGMFCYCKLLTSLNLSNFNTSNVTSMRDMFFSCESLTSLDLSSFNTSNVKDMSGMFRSCKSLTSLNLSNFDTPKVTTMSNMFNSCEALTSLNLSNFNTSNVTSMGYMFENCKLLTSLDLSNFNTSNVTNMTYMFGSCQLLTSLDLSNFNTSNVIYMSDMFENCKLLTSLDLSSFNTSNVIDMSYMFSGCESLTSLDLSNFNTEKVIYMRNIFEYCKTFTSLDLSSFNTSNVTNMTDMFRNCLELETIYVSSLWNTNKVLVNFSGMFMNCLKIVGLYETTYDSSKIDKTYARIDSPNQKGYLSSYIEKGIYDDVDWLIDSRYRLFIGKVGEEQTFINRDRRNASDWPWYESYSINITSVSFSGLVNGSGSHAYMFYNCQLLTSLDLSNFDTSNVTNMKGMFSDCNSLTSLDFSGFNTSSVTDMSYMFYSCYVLASLNLSKFDTPNVISMNSMFYYCSFLTSLDLSNFNTSKVKDMSSMFGYCERLTRLDISHFDTSSVTAMRYMFSNCNKLPSLDLSSFNTSSVTDMKYMFNNCESLASLDLSNFNISNVTNMYRMFYNCPTSIDIFYVSNCSKQQGGTEDIDVTDMFDNFTGKIFLMRPENIINPTGVKEFWREVAATNSNVHFEYDDTGAPTAIIRLIRGKFKHEFDPEEDYYIRKEDDDSSESDSNDDDYIKVDSPIEEHIADYYYRVKITEDPLTFDYKKMTGDEDFIPDDAGGNVIKVIPNINIQQDNNTPDQKKVGKNTLTNIRPLLKNNNIIYDSYIVSPHKEGSLNLKEIDIEEFLKKSEAEQAFYIILEKSTSEQQYSLEVNIYDRREDAFFPFKVIIPGVFAMIEFRKGGHGMSIGKICERDGLEVSIPTAIGEGLLLPTTTNSNDEEVIDLTKDQLVIGRYNIKDSETDPDKQKAFIIGNGTDNDGTITRSNALTIDWQGNISIPTGHIDTIDMTTTEISNFIAELNVSGAPINTTQDDWVVEQGMSGIWTYRKWQSGTVDCLFGSTTITGSTGALYLYRAGNIVFLSSNGAFRSSSSSIANATKLSQTIPSGFRPIAKAYNMSVSATKNWRLEIASTGDIYFYGDTAWDSGLYLSGVWVTNDNISV